MKIFKIIRNVPAAWRFKKCPVGVPYNIYLNKLSCFHFRSVLVPLLLVPSCGYLPILLILIKQTTLLCQRKAKEAQGD